MLPPLSIATRCRRLAIALCALSACATPALAAAASDDDLAALRAEVSALRADYEQRLSELERRLAQAEQRAESAEREASDARMVAEDVAYAPQATLPNTPSTFNPSIGAVFIGTYSDAPGAELELPGFQLAGEPAPGDGFSLGESEFNFNANVDDKFFANLTLALADEDGIEIELEEAFIQTLTLPHQLQLTAGRFFSGIGYLNGFHLHADDFIDRPLPYQAFLAGQYLDDGAQLRWLAPTDQYLEFGVELLRGATFPAGGESDGQDAWSAFVKTGGDFAPGHSWKAGLGYLDASARARSGGHGHGEDEDGHDEHDEDENMEAFEEGFTGDSELWLADFVYKWSPGGNNRNRNLQIQGEYFRRDEDGVFDGLAYNGEQSGWYLQGLYQWRPGWRAGYRRDTVDADNLGVVGTELDDLGLSPRRDSLVLEWFNSEFSRVRLQYSRDSGGEQDDDQVYLQYIMAIGAHRAHQF